MLEGELIGVGNRGSRPSDQAVSSLRINQGPRHSPSPKGRGRFA